MTIMVRHQRLSSRVALAALAAATALTASLMTACSDDGDTADANTITVYSGRNVELVEPLIEKFEKETGIEVELRGGGTPELAAQLLTEGDNSPADIFFAQDAGALGAVSKAGLFQELPTDVVGLVPDRFRAHDSTWVGTSGRSRVIVYNPDIVPEPPTEIDELLDPQWKGRIGFAPTNASWHSFVTVLRLQRGEDEAREWLEKFVANEPKAYENNAVVRDAVDAGDVALGPINHYYLYELIAEVGAENVTAKNQFLTGGDAGGLVNVAGVGLLKTAPHQDDALKLIRFLLDTEAQEYFATATFEYPLVDGVAPPDGVPELSELDPPDIDLSDLDSLEQTQELLADVGLLTR